MTNNHLHTYRRVRTEAGKTIYICTHPDCTHNSRRELIVSKRAQCYVCGEPYVITAKTLRYLNLRCEECRKDQPKVKSQKSISNSQLLEFMKDLETVEVEQEEL